MNSKATIEKFFDRRLGIALFLLNLEGDYSEDYSGTDYAIRLWLGLLERRQD